MKLIQRLSGKKDIYIINWLVSKHKTFDSKFTFYRGNLHSQNYLVMTNNIDMISSFQIMDKLIYSDHCPSYVTCTVNPLCSMGFIRQCLDGAFNDGHWDINKRKVILLKFSTINWENAIGDVEVQSCVINNFIH